MQNTMRLNFESRSRVSRILSTDSTFVFPGRLNRHRSVTIDSTTGKFDRLDRFRGSYPAFGARHMRPPEFNPDLRLCSYMTFFTALYGMQTRSSDANSVRLSVKRAWIVTILKKHLSRFLFIPYERSFSQVF